MSESNIQNSIIQYLKSVGYVVFKTIVSSRRGVSDIIACSKEGQFLAIEVKDKGKLKQVSDLQQRFIDDVNENNGVAFATDNLNTVKDKIK